MRRACVPGGAACAGSSRAALSVRGAIPVLLAFVLLACAAFMGWEPGAAFAYFNEATDSYPAAQELGAFGEPITGSQLPDGAYKVGARTTSRMCILYTNPEDAEARDSKEQAVITVNGSSITAVFYLSKAYTHLFLGTQEQAAAATNAEGTDPSAYIAGDPDGGYVPHLFTLAVPALNSPMTISTFSGGDRGIESGKWYTRQVVFTMSDAELKAAQEEASAAAPQDAGATGGGGQSGAQASAGGASGSVTSAEGGTAGNGAGGGAVAVSDGASGDDGDGSKDGSRANADSRRGVLLSFAGSALETAVGTSMEEGSIEPETPPVSPRALLALVLLVVFAAGAGFRAHAFGRSFGDSPKSSEVCSEKTG